MINFISENLGSLLVGIIVLAIVVLAVIKVIRDKRSLSCSCGGGCSGCPGSGTCNISNNNTESSANPSEIKIKRINEKPK